MTTQHRTIVPMDQLTAAERTQAGSKAFNCARLRQAGFPVPDGLVVLSTATAEDIAAVAAHSWFDGIAAETSFAVRSSGLDEDGDGESFAGIHQTVLDVSRRDVASAIITCQASAGAPQARDYRHAKGLADAGTMGVLVQCLVRPLVAGVAFTANPVTGAADEMVINASWGMGEALVNGHVDPDEFVIDKGPLTVRWSRLGAKGGERSEVPSLTPGQLAELSSMLVAIERHYGAVQDIEWCHDGGRFWIVQSRPVTTLPASRDGTEWTRANLAEVFPDITSPQALAVFEEVLEQAERRYLGSLAAPAEELGRIVKRFHGRLYFNLSQLRHVCALAGMPPAVMLKSMGHADALHPSDEIAAPRSLKALRHVPAMLRMAWRHLRARQVVAAHNARTSAHLARFAAVDPRTLPDSAIWSAIEAWFSDAPEYMQTVLLLGGVLFHEAPVRKACARVGFPFEQLMYPHLAAGERSVSAQQAFDLVELADIARRDTAVCQYLQTVESSLPQLRGALRGTEFLAAFERFLVQYGHRARYEYDWSLPRYREEPFSILQTIRAHLAERASHPPMPLPALREYEAESVMTVFEGRLSRRQRLTLLPVVRRAIRNVKQYYVWREQVRSDLVRVLEVLREWHLVLADRFVARGWLNAREDYFFLHYPEIAAAVRADASADDVRAIVARRRAEQDRNRRIRMPLLMRERDLPLLVRTTGLTGGDDGGEITGQPVSTGCVEGEVVVVRDPGDFTRMKRGAILVAPATDPSWTPLFTLAAGVIVEVGGVLSHASTIAREYGLPALANVRQATTRLRTGERVRLDAFNGHVHRLSSSPQDHRATTATALASRGTIDAA